MELYFLTSTEPIRKEYHLNERGTLKKRQYPFVHRFSSFYYELNTIEEFFYCVREYAQEGHCLLKGNLQHPLKNESRAGATSPESLTQWVCLDFDGVKSWEDVDLALHALQCGKVDYILQWSSTAGLPGEGCRIHAHVFMLLEEPQHPSILKLWLKHLNLSTELQNELTLAKSHNALLWPLDITTCQNDKLIYIAPPRFEGLSDPISKRITLEKREYRYLELPTDRIPTEEQIRMEEITALNKIRKDAGLKARRNYDYNHESDIPFLQNPDAAQVTGIKTERDFVYLNLNGGDSWGYFHPINNPTYIYNFKGEPIYRTKDLAPAYWKEIKARNQNMEPDASGRVYLAFRNFDPSGYWNGIYDSGSQALIKLAPAQSKDQLRDFMKQYGQPMGDFVPTWDIKFDPHDDKVLDRKNRKLNIYRPSEYFSRDPVVCNTVPPTIEKVIFHALGSDSDIYEYFLNWLAVIAQKLTMTGTAWVVHGTQGTGKGVMFNYILTPLFGTQNVTSRRMEELGSDFTEFMKNKLIVFIDEVQAGNNLFHEKITAKLKNLIVEPRISVREMYKPATVMDNYCNLIFASNNPRPVHIAPDDRRFNVGAYQHEPIDLTANDIAVLDTEIGDFYDYLCTRSADAELARKPMDTVDRRRIINLSRNSIDEAVEALLEGNSQFFEDMLVSDPSTISHRKAFEYDQYEQLINELKKTGRTKLSRDELMIIMRWCTDKIPDTAHKFTAMMRHHGLELQNIWIDGKTVRGIDVEKWV